MWIRWISMACLSAPCTAFTMIVDDQLSSQTTLKYTLANPTIEKRGTIHHGQNTIAINQTVKFVLKIDRGLATLITIVQAPYDVHPHCYGSLTVKCEFNSDYTIVILTDLFTHAPLVQT